MKSDIYKTWSHIAWIKYEPVRQVIHGFWFTRMTTRLTNRADGVVIPKFSVLIKVFLQDAQEDIP